MTNAKLKSLVKKITFKEECIINLEKFISAKDLTNLLYSIYVTQSVDYKKRIKEFHLDRVNFLTLIYTSDKIISDVKNTSILNSHIKILGAIVKYNKDVKNNQIKYYI